MTVTVVRAFTPAFTAQWCPVGNTSDRRQQCRVGGDGQLHQRALGLRDADGLALAAVDAVAGPQPAVPAGCLQPFPAEVAGPVGPDERREDQIAAGETHDLRADLLDEAQELMPDPLAGVAVRHRAVRPQVTAADAGADDADQGVGGSLDDRVRDGLDADITRAVNDGCTHGKAHFPSCECGGVRRRPVQRRLSASAC
jgi:hypothetical protein